MLLTLALFWGIQIMQDYYMGLGAAHLRLIYVDMLVLEPGVSFILTCLATRRHVAPSTTRLLQASSLARRSEHGACDLARVYDMHRMKAYRPRTRSMQPKPSEPRH